MRHRKCNTRKPNTSIFIIGEGPTEENYFKHLKEIMGYKYKVQSQFFRDNSIESFSKKIENFRQADAKVICVIDADVAKRDKTENKKLEKFISKYKKNKNVLICTSLPCIEFWFLLHYERKNCNYGKYDQIEKDLRRHIGKYKKHKTFLENPKWVKELCNNDKWKDAIHNAKACTNREASYSDIYMIFDFLELLS